MLLSSHASSQAQTPTLALKEFGTTDSTAYFVTSTLIVGPTEVLLWDAQMTSNDAARLADTIAATHRKLEAIVISHPDHDHFTGAATILKRFPGTPVYMTPAAIAVFNAKTSGVVAWVHKLFQPVVTPTPLPSNHLTVDGADVEVIPDLGGDVVTPTNSILWVPSLNAVLAADVVFNGIHPWLGSSDPASRERWHQSLRQIASLHPTAVVAGHKRHIDAADSPDILAFMDQYLTAFDSAVKAGPDAATVVKTMEAEYPQLAVHVLLDYSSKVAFHQASMQ
jgi:glyoxylase-like metal-dependent hydrolase (beta-lactamase superfamily II)